MRSYCHFSCAGVIGTFRQYNIEKVQRLDGLFCSEALTRPAHDRSRATGKLQQIAVNG